MRRKGDDLIYSPSDLINFTENPFITWADRYHLEFSSELTPDEDGEEAKVFQRLGQEHESMVLERFRSQRRVVAEISRTDEAFDRTIHAMSRGAEIIYQGALRRGQFAGYSDFLVRIDQPSNLGMHSYEVWDTKLARRAKPYFVIQLCCYAEMLEAVQGFRPKTIGVILGDGSTQTFRTDDYFFHYLSLKNAFLGQQATFNLGNRPVPLGTGRNGRWEKVGREWLTSHDHLRLVAGISTVQIQRFELAGVKTVQGLADCQENRIPNMLEMTYHRLRHQAQLQVKSRSREVPLLDILTADPEDPRKGLALLPPASEMDVVLDIEGFPLVEGGLEYLFGVTYLENGESQFRDWWAHNPAEERKAFEDALDWICARRKADPSMHVYHYAPYEETALERLMGKYGTREIEMDDLLRNEVLIDLYKVVREGVRIGTENYSLKSIECLYRKERSTEITGGGDSIVFYERWLTTKDGTTWQNSSILREIRDYNCDDCVSTWELKEWLRQRQVENKIAYIPPSPPKKQSTDIDVNSVLAKELLKSIPSDRSGDVERWRVQELIAYLIEFHRREDRPMWWTLFNRLEMTEEELYDDKDCLAGLRRTSRAPEQIKKSQGFEYSFDADQDTTIHEDDNCVLSRDLNLRIEIARFDAEDGLTTLKVSPAGLAKSPGGSLPKHLNLVPYEYVGTDDIVASIASIAANYKQTGQLPSALADFLYRRRPRFKDKRQGSVLANGNDVVAKSIDAIANMDHTTLCIQGPPGAGKTFTGACIITELLRQGKRIAISSNSHKAIINLMTEVAKSALKKGVHFAGAKIRDAEGLEGYKNIEPVDKIEHVEPHHGLVGGTAWPFSSAAAIGMFDYLFVDEAGQVSIANLMGMSPCSKNIVLIGDQMQLSQPTQGAHPGDSGRSTLDYLLDGLATIPDNLGIFLSKTWRMRPEVCRFISESVYEGRLESESVASSRHIVFSGNGKPKYVRKVEGLLFFPVEHEGNSQGSEEEVDVIREVIRELRECDFVNETGVKNKIGLQDIVVVAPYNLQVRMLKRALGSAARIGTIDKFQGQQAAVSIISMCASAPDASARGLDFLLNKNRLNVAISRAQCLSIIVGHPSLGHGRCTTLRQMELSNLFCRAVAEASN